MAVIAARVGRLRDRSAFVDVAVATMEKRKADNERRLAAEITYYSFFSVFPLLMVFVTVIQTMFGDKAKDQIVNSALSQFPVIGTQLLNQISSPGGRGLATVVGLLIALWAGTRAFESFDHAIYVIWRGPGAPPTSVMKGRLRGLVVMLILGLAILVTTIAGSILSRIDFLPVGVKPLTWLVSIALNTAVILLVFAFVNPDGPQWRAELPGAIIGGVGWTILQTVGALFVDYVIRGASDTYGTFAVVIGLLTWINVQIRLVLLAAEINSVLARRQHASAPDTPRVLAD